LLKACSAKCRAWHYYRDVSRTHWWVCAFLDGGPWHAAFLSLSSHLVHTRTQHPLRIISGPGLDAGIGTSWTHCVLP
jgi:hypothetical protein